MTKISDALTYGLTIRESATDGSDFTNPAADYRRLFLGEDGQLHLRDSAGTVTDIGAAAKASAVHVFAGNYHITTTTFADVNATDLGLSITTAASASLLVMCQTSYGSDGTNRLCLDIAVDGTRVSGVADGLARYAPTAALPVSFFGMVTGLSAGSHTVRVQARMDPNAGSGGDIGQSTALATILIAIEL